MLSDSFKVYAKALIALDRLMRSGREDSDAADALRDQMDRPWSTLSVGERTLARVLSTDLYDLDEPAPDHLPQPQSDQDREALRELINLAQNKNWEHFLEKIRSVQQFIPPAFAAYLRGRAWYELGDADIAWLFLDRACQLDPKNMNFRYFALDVLSRCSHTAGAEKISAAILAELTEDATARIYQELIRLAS